jgi:hypothetical protein
MTTNDKFWMFDITQLFRSIDLIPNQEDSLSTKLNTIMRLALVASILISFYKPIIGFSTLIIVMAITMSVYSSVSNPIIEQFENNSEVNEFMREYNSTRNPKFSKVGFPPTQTRFCDDGIPLEFNISANQQLTGSAHPKTLIPPFIAAPSHDLESWKTNDFVVHSQINRTTNFDADKSGYGTGCITTTDNLTDNPATCSSFNNSYNTSYNTSPNSFYNTSPNNSYNNSYNNSSNSFNKCMECMYVPCLCKEDKNKEIISNLVHGIGEYGIEETPLIKQYVKDVLMDRKLEGINDFEIDKIVNEAAVRVNSEYLKRDNLITHTLQPGVFQKSHIAQPIQSNIGISFNQEWGPTEVHETNNTIKYTTHDPSVKIPTRHMNDRQNVRQNVRQDNSNIYDPRFTGYGTSYRSYVDRLTGRPKYFYDDVDSITMPNYITRSNIDVFPWAGTYGPDTIQNVKGDEYRQLANRAFTESSLTFRTELQERLMRKRNAELWQRRIAPMTTMGSGRSCL